MTQKLVQIIRKFKFNLNDFAFALIVGFVIAMAAVTNIGKASPAFPLEFGTLFLFVSMAVTIEHGLSGIASAAIGNLIGIGFFILILITKEINTADILLISRAYLEAFVFALFITLALYLATKIISLIVNYYKEKTKSAG